MIVVLLLLSPLLFFSSFFLVEDGLLFFRLANAGRHSNVHEETIDPSITWAHLYPIRTQVSPELAT